MGEGKPVVLLINPLFRVGNGSDNLVEYLGFGYIKAFLNRHNVKTQVIDVYLEDLSLVEVVEKISQTEFDILGFTLMSSLYFSNMQKILDGIPEHKLSNIHITVGGYYATFELESLLEKDNRINSVVVGEGEYTLLELAYTFNKVEELKNIKGLIYRNECVIVINEKRELMSTDKLNNLPFPSRDHLDIVLRNNKNAQVSSSRGCYGNCSFCGVNSFFSLLKGPKWRCRSVNNVIEEIEYLKKNFGVKNIDFTDEEFIGSSTSGQLRAEKIAKAIINKKLDINFMIFCRSSSVQIDTFELLKLAGLKLVFLGIEFGVDKLLTFYNKGLTVEDNIEALNILKDLNIRTSAGYIMFEPLMDIDTFRQNLKFFRNHCRFVISQILTKLVIYPNTMVYEQLKDRINISDKLSFSDTIGDYYEYEFYNKKVQILYKILKEGLKVISPSKRYKAIHKSHHNRHILLEAWTEAIYKRIDNLALRLEKDNNVSDDRLHKYLDDFKKDLLAWDNGPIDEVTNSQDV